jgi:hypothetical protein
VDLDSPAAATIQNFSVQMSAAPGAGNSVVYTWRKNAAGTALTCTISGASATSCNDATHTITVVQGDLMDIQTVTTGTIVGTPTLVMGTQFGIAASSGVTSLAASGLVGVSAATGAVTVSLNTQAADTVDMNSTGSTAVPTAVAMPTCTTGADLYNTSTHSWSCVSTGGGFTPVTVTASGVAVEFIPGTNNCFDGTHNVYDLTFYLKVAGANNTIVPKLQVHTSGGGYDTGGSDYLQGRTYTKVGAASQGGDGSVGAGFGLTGTPTTTDNSGVYATGTMTLYFPSSTVPPVHQMNGHWTFFSVTGSVQYDFTSGGYWNNNAVYDGFRFYIDGTDTWSGTVTCNARPQ